MFTWRIFALLALTYSVQGGADWDSANKLLECCRRAIFNGVPTVPIPSHNPLVIPHNISLSGSVFEVLFNATINNIVWYGIPQWESRVAEQLNDDSDPFAVFNFDMHWKSLNMTMNYDVDYYNMGSISSAYEGQIILNWTGTDWVGQINATKPGFGAAVQVNDLFLAWVVDYIDAVVSGMGDMNEQAAKLISSGITNYLDNILGTGLSSLFLSNLNNYWLSNSTKVSNLLDWCDDN